MIRNIARSSTSSVFIFSNFALWSATKKPTAMAQVMIIPYHMISNPNIENATGFTLNPSIPSPGNEITLLIY